MSATENFLASRQCLVAPIPELDEVADLLAAAADAMLADRMDEARRCLLRADMPKVHAYAARIMGPMDREIHRYRSSGIAVNPSNPSNVKQRMPGAAVEKAINERDGYRCRFCCCRVVGRGVRNAMSVILPNSIRWGDKDAERHAALFALNATTDHLVPHARGGDNEALNLVTTCQSCNFGHGAYLLEEMGLSDPRLRAPFNDGWDGLMRVMSKPNENGKAKSTNNLAVPSQQKSPSLSHEAWFAGLDRIHVGSSERLLTILDGCKDLDVSWSLNKVLLARLDSGEGPINAFGVESDISVQIPWSLGKHKHAFKEFAHVLADAIPGAVAYETPKMWRVRKDGRPVTLRELLDAGPAIRAAFEVLHAAVR